MTKIIDRCTYIEWFQVLCVATLLIASIFYGTDEFHKVISLVTQFGVAPAMALTITALQIPSNFIYCLPAGVLMATMLVLWRRSSDYELVAMRAAGISLRRILLPFAVLGIAATIVAFLLSEFVVPSARKTANRLIVVSIYKSDLPAINGAYSGCEFGSGNQIKRILLVGKYLEKKLNDVMIFDLQQKGLVKLIVAETGLWKNGCWLLDSGHIYEVLGREINRRDMRFENMTIQGMTSFSVDDDSKSLLPVERNTADLMKYIAEQTKLGKPISASTLLHLYMRFSQPVACLLLVLSACSLGLRPTRTRASRGLIIAGVIVAFYFLLQEIFFSLGEDGQFDPFLCAWIPGAVIGIIGAVSLTWRIKSRSV